MSTAVLLFVSVLSEAVAVCCLFATEFVAACCPMLRPVLCLSTCFRCVPVPDSCYIAVCQCVIHSLQMLVPSESTLLFIYLSIYYRCIAHFMHGAFGVFKVQWLCSWFGC